MAYITLNKANFFYNLDQILLRTKSKEKIALVLKDNAYGHGIVEIASLAKEYGISKAVVQSNAEAEVIKQFFAYVLVLADTPTQVSEKIRYTINDINTIKAFPKGSLVELKVNTGMNRNGIEMHELSSALALIQTQGLKLEAIFTHHGCADECNEMYALQKKRFETLKALAPEGLRFHSCNSAALFRDENFSEDMARVGIAAYGYLQLPSDSQSPSLKPVLSLYAQKISSRILNAGDRVGYGAVYRVQKTTTVSNYDFGYGHGFLRSLSNIYTTPDNVKIAGRISMDNSSFMSTQENLLIFNDALIVASMAGTIAYEVLTSLKASIAKRVI